MLILMVLLFCGFIGSAIGSTKNRGTLGFLLGMTLGLLGWIIIAVVPAAPGEEIVAPSKYVCPSCRKPIDPEASICATCLTKVIPKA